MVRLHWAVITMAAVVGGASSLHAGPLTYIVSGGIGAAEAENYTTVVNRTTGDLESWVIITDGGPDDPYNTPTGGKYLRPMPNNNVNVLTLGAEPYVEYHFRVSSEEAGAYKLYARLAAGNSNDSSIYYQVYAVGDSPQIVDGSSQHMVVDIRDNLFRFSAGSATFNLTAGDYVVRFNSREDGVGFDKLVLQLAELPAPTGDGPAVSQSIIPEPAAGGMLLSGLFFVHRRRRFMERH